MTSPLPAEDVDYLRDVRPILVDRCASCHGSLKQESGLRLDTGAAVHRGGDGGPVIIPGDSRSSRLIEAVTGDLEIWRMPPEGPPLAPEQIQTLRAWIDGGAVFPEDEPVPADPRGHWAFQPLRVVKLPPVADPAESHPIDRLLAAVRPANVRPAPMADSDTRLRRVYVDLTGLLPTLEELKEFRDDPSSAAYERVVDKLLASPAYGERWGRHWMDVWRYCDAFYAEEGTMRYTPHSEFFIWHWRDWIMRSLNENRGYNEMVRDMLAGDEIAPNDHEALAATGYLLRSKSDLGGGRDLWLDELIEHVGKAFLGVTIKCAQCHDHKYDPISQLDYYRFRAIFEPMDGRIDSFVPSGDIMENGLPRAFDKQLDAATYLYRTGGPLSKDENVTLGPGVPEAFPGRWSEPRPIEIPLEARNAAMSPAVREYELEQARKSLDEARSALAQLTTGGQTSATSDGADETVPEAEPSDESEERRPERQAAWAAVAEKLQVEPATAVELRQRLASLTVEAAEWNLKSVKAVIAADDAKYSASENAANLAQTASEIQHKLAIVRKQSKLIESLCELQKKVLLSDTPPEEIDAAVAEWQQTKESLQRLESKTPDGTYKPLRTLYPEKSSGRRTALAEWMFDSENPMAARVAVNHIWMRHFGRGLVPTEADFGRNGQPPSHPDLLDWLARWFRAHEWDMKALHRLIVTSAAYQRSSDPDSVPESHTADPDNGTYWRANAQRMQSEVVRDCILQWSGQLDRSMGGAPVKLEEAAVSTRRSVYLVHSIQERLPLMCVFDAADPVECYERSESIVPQQALALLNGRLSLECSRQIADRLGSSGPELLSDNEFVERAFVALLGRRPDAFEIGRCAAFLQVPVPGDTASTEARGALVHVLLNHHDFITIR